jgi:hypothetical protein
MIQARYLDQLLPTPFVDLLDLEGLLAVKEILGGSTVQIRQQHKFHDIESSISRLRLGDPRVEHTQAFSHVPMCEPCFFSRTDELREETIVTSLERRGPGLAGLPSFSLRGLDHSLSVVRPCAVS